MFSRHLTGFRGFSRKHGSIPKGVLERSSKTNPRKISPSPRRSPERPSITPDDIVTLDPSKFVEKKQQCLDISNKQTFKPCITLHKQSSPLMTPRLSYDRTVPLGTHRYNHFPPDTKAFLYYFAPPKRPRIAGELRFRVVSSDDPASFASGSDLLRLNGQPWSRPLYALSNHYAPLYAKLREDRLIPDDLDAVLSTFPQKPPIGSRSQLLYTLNDTFIINIGSHGTILTVITEQGVEILPFLKPLFDNRIKYRRAPYTGSTLVRFERSTLPDHKGTRTVVVRFLKIITPVQRVTPNYDGYIRLPEEGGLLQKCRYGSDQHVWSVDIDQPKGAMLRGLRLLWDT